MYHSNKNNIYMCIVYRLQFSIIDFKKVVPLIIFVVATTNSTFESSCCDKNLNAEI